MGYRPLLGQVDVVKGRAAPTFACRSLDVCWRSSAPGCAAWVFGPWVR